MPRRIIRRVVLERCARPLLARLLAAHAGDFLGAHGFPIDGLGATAASDRAPVHRLFALIHDAALTPPLPEPARALLTALDALATPHGADEILRADPERRLPRATYGDEDLALVALLEHPELARAARRAAEADAAQGFTEYDPADARPLAFGDAERERLVDVLGPMLEARDRTRYCRVHVTREADTVSLEIVHARRPRTLDKVDARDLALHQSTDIHTEHAFVEIDLGRGQVAVHAAVGVKELVREALGRALTGDGGFFRGARTYDLAPFKDLAAALSIEDAPARLREVELHEIAVATAAGSVVTFARPRRSVLGDRAVEGALGDLLATGTPVAAKLYLAIDGRERKLRVELAVNEKRCRVDFDRQDADVVEIVRGYLRARGVLRDGEQAAPFASTAPEAPAALTAAG